MAPDFGQQVAAGSLEVGFLVGFFTTIHLCNFSTVISCDVLPTCYAYPKL